MLHLAHTSRCCCRGWWPCVASRSHQSVLLRGWWPCVASHSHQSVLLPRMVALCCVSLAPVSVAARMVALCYVLLTPVSVAAEDGGPVLHLTRTSQCCCRGWWPCVASRSHQSCSVAAEDGGPVLRLARTGHAVLLPRMVVLVFAVWCCLSGHCGCIGKTCPRLCGRLPTKGQWRGIRRLSGAVLHVVSFGRGSMVSLQHRDIGAVLGGFAKYPSMAYVQLPELFQTCTCGFLISVSFAS